MDNPFLLNSNQSALYWSSVHLADECCIHLYRNHICFRIKSIIVGQVLPSTDTWRPRTSPLSASESQTSTSMTLLFLQIIPFWLSVTHPVSVRLALEHPLISSLVRIEYELQHRVSPFAHVNKSMLVTKVSIRVLRTRTVHVQGSYSHSRQSLSSWPVTLPLHW